MKTIAVLTDFSPASEHAARYGMHLAQKTKARVLLYTTSPVSSEVGGSDYTYEEPIADSANPLDDLAERLCYYMKERSFPGSFLPMIDTCPDEDFITNSFLSIEEGKETALLVIAASPDDDGGATPIAWWRKAIETATIPVLIVPENAAIRNVERFVFATDASFDDIDHVNMLSGLAKLSSAEIMVAGVIRNDNMPDNFLVTRFKDKLLTGVDYGRLYYRIVPSTPVKNGLEWLIENRSFDMLAMVYRKGALSNLLFNRGMIETLLYRKSIPVLIYPDVKAVSTSQRFKKIIPLAKTNIPDHEIYNERRIA